MAYRTVFLVLVMILVDRCQSTNRTEQVIALQREMGEMMIKYGDKINEAAKFMTKSSESANKVMESMKGWHQDVASKAAARKGYIADTLEYLKAFEDAVNEEIKMYDEARTVAQEYSKGIHDLENETCAASGRLFHKAAVALNPHTEQMLPHQPLHQQPLHHQPPPHKTPHEQPPAKDDGSNDDTPRRLIYYSPSEEGGPQPVTLQQIYESVDSKNQPHITHIEICTLHLSANTPNPDPNFPSIHINDRNPGHPMFKDIKAQIPKAQSLGIKVMFMVGGWADGSFPALFNNWDTVYPDLIKLCKEWGVDGIDMDCELGTQWQSGVTNYENIEKLITNLKNDMHDAFDIALAPVARALSSNDPGNHGGLSGFNYKSLMQDEGDDVSWLNVQFYNGWGSLRTPALYERIVSIRNGFKSEQVVAGMLLTEYNGGGKSRYLKTITALSREYGTKFGGVFVWGGNDKSVVQWGIDMAKAMEN